MTTSSLPSEARAGTHHAGPTQLKRPQLGRLTALELRKMTDTRAGFWLLVVITVAAAGMVVLQLFTGQGQGRSFARIFAGTLMPVGILLPVLGVLSVTSEWSQRTAVTTLTLVPSRWRTAAAKLLAGGALAASSVAVCLGVAAAGNLLVGPLVDGNGSWTLDAAVLGTSLLAQVIYVIMGMAFGMLFMNTPLAIVLYFVLPTAWTIMGQFIGALRTAREWLDQIVTLTPLTNGQMTADSWARVGATVGVWVLLPLVIGLVRLMRREVS